ncbi:serine/threonine protein kinase [Alkalihalobacillus alcalophilus ATCC 27647 = CGMCC 1.3604]|uniref:Serine/threonine-protein kinase PrkC n=1 Tax=Alkalihalobacillus alcalophilus ATCC 27647 = CGMCC 1.3604 TaxID=1218173 RepID=A0A094WLP5_ALKAL|nr:Stk1 family PASTA domain-containing Ser/Thr kinase [Alkalihalobacillus alcalophilus]KGA97741.1 serine/threonine protein kinase [Alkalihalobacillus alcalophilus ATCC 27647 = CGMCC 1.3604]MED1563154.1 Stk1 family PASTA domain-containing Ser/Thr kinase [Alkalihalobacillus alcalophilus]THG91815.1 serine/threonine protein kinase [Alkalihalobacillus alcalophilus ATCC 27647 = CGMCC 1.3604]
MIGERINGRYEVKEMIGGGGMANVYMALDVILDRIVAVKVLQPQFSGDDQFIKRFRREAQAATSLAHENVVNIYDVGEEGDIYYIVMEYVKGQTLKELIQDVGPLPTEQAIQIMDQILSAISHAHDNHIVHRDIKPHNILIRDDGVAKVADFGIARAMSAATITHTNSVMGSVHYLSPEQARGGHVTYKSDIYSLGIVLYEMVTGTLPFSGDTAVSIAIKHLQNEIPSAKAIITTLPQSIENIIKKATIKDPLHRYETIRSMRYDLETALAPGRLNEQPYVFTDDDHEVTKAIPIIKSLGDQQDLSHTIEAPPTKIKSDGVAAANTNVDPVPEQKKEIKKEKKKSKVKKWLMITIITLLVLLGAGIATFALMPGLFKVDEVEVIDFVGMSFEEAEETLERLNLEPQRHDVTSDELSEEDEFEAEQVTRQRPNPGSIVKEGAIVHLYVLLAAEEVVIPSVIGDPVERASRELRDLGFEVETEGVESTQTPGIVLTQTPEAGEAVVPSETKVVLTYSVDSRFRLQPLDGMTKDEVESYFDEQGLKADFREDFHANIEENYVISYSPDAYSNLLPGDTVRVVISKGPEAVEEPDPDEEEPDEEQDEPTQRFRINIKPEIPEELEGTAFDIRIVVRDASSNGEERVEVEEQITSTGEYVIDIYASQSYDAIIETYVNGELDEEMSGTYVFSD